MNEALFREIEAVLPRVLGAFDRNALSNTQGLGDRQFWAWKTIDFPNATMQGAANGLARLVAAHKLPWGLDEDAVIAQIDSTIRATGRLAARGEGLCEAFPHEQSFCVTALIAYDTLVALDQLKARISEAKRTAWRDAVAPLIKFLLHADETHAIISNHLATGVAALLRWHAETGDAEAEKRARALLDRILAHQSSEGWFAEYGGPDPGYETLGLTYLADAHVRRPDLKLAEPLKRSLAFLRYCAHPDGSFGGLYGARNTRFIVPGGIAALASTFPDAAALSRFAAHSIADRKIVTLSAFDDGNLAPLFNAYCWAALTPPAEGGALCFEEAPAQKHFPKAGLVINNHAAHYTILSTHKGGVVAHFPKNGSAALIDSGVAVRRGAQIGTTQAWRPDNDVRASEAGVEITAPLQEAATATPTPFQFAILRLLSITIFRSRPLAEAFKRFVIRRLVTRAQPFGATNTRKITWGAPPAIEDSLSDPSLERIAGPFTAIHMASSGYWQAWDDSR